MNTAVEVAHRVYDAFLVWANGGHQVSNEKKPCGLYRTTVPTIDGIQADRLVYYHNHGDPGPGVYYPERWVNNRAVFSDRGHTIPSGDYAQSLETLPEEGFYKVEARFHCCDKMCREFKFGELVQLGYDSGANPILFLPGYRNERFELPESGIPVDRGALNYLEPLRIQQFGKAQGHD